MLFAPTRLKSHCSLIMKTNRSMPPGIVIPELAYSDISEAVTWLCNAFGFRERVRIGNHRTQLTFGAGSMIAIEGGRARSAGANATQEDELSHAVMVRVENIDRHFERAQRFGARIIRPPADYPYGERQYTVADLGGHVWTFSESIADVHPEEWGGSLIEGS
jgi:uncharacterized glyoxalase superfamily protein PhnB